MCLLHYWPWLFSAGVVLTHLLPSLPGPGWCLALVPIVIYARRSEYARCCVCFLLGAGWVVLAAQLRLAERLPASMAGQDLRVRAAVISPPAMAERSARILVQIPAGQAGLQQAVRARLSWHEAPPTLRAGQWWNLVVRLRQPRGFANPGGFDYEGWLFRNGIGATGYVRSAEPLPDGADTCCALLRARMRIARALTVACGDSVHAGLFAALAVGLRDDLSETQRAVLRGTGTSHLMAISGLHIGMVGGLAFSLVRRVAQRYGSGGRCWTASDAGAVAAMLAGGSYAVLAGLTLPTQRALIMLALGLTALSTRRPRQAARVFGVSLAIVLAVDPLAPLDPGFWLSFGAVFALLVGVAGSAGVARGWLRAQWVIFVALAPLGLWLFGGLAISAPIVNLLLIPLFSVLVLPPVLLAAACVLPMPALASVLLWVPEQVLDFIWPLLSTIAAWPGAWLNAPPQPAWALLYLLPAIGLALAPRGFPLRFLAPVYLLPVLLLRPSFVSTGDFQIDVLDVGQGLSVVVRTAGHVLLYDAGPSFRSGGNAGNSVVLPFLQASRIATLDRLIVSHADDDHSGGVAAVRAGLAVHRVRGGGGQDALPACKAGERWRWDGVDFELLHPGAGRSWRGNDGSCVLRIDGAGGSVLLTGDIEQAAENALLASGLELAADIAIAPHHGSATSSGARFVAAVAPRYVVFSTALGNRWQFPRQDVVARWISVGACPLDTGRSGHLAFTVSAADGVLPPRQYRASNRRYWSAPVVPAPSTYGHLANCSIMPHIPSFAAEKHVRNR